MLLNVKEGTSFFPPILRGRKRMDRQTAEGFATLVLGTENPGLSKR